MSLPHLVLSWILSKVENLASSSLQDEATDWLFFTELLGPSLIINLAQLVSPSVALPAELVFFYFWVGDPSQLGLRIQVRAECGNMVNKLSWECHTLK